MEIAGWLNYWEGWLGQEYDSHQHKAANGEWGVKSKQQLEPAT